MSPQVPESREVDIDYQCGRCGSSLAWEPCATCEASGDIELHTGYGVPDCPTCHGDGTMPVCLSSAAWCEANPLPGNEHIPRHTPEAFEVRR